MKIAIIGNAGSGKSTLALELHKILHIPVYHLDKYFWKPGWIEPDRNDFEKIHNALCEKSSWIIEGMAIRFFEYRIQKADVVIFIDTPRYICFYRVFKRSLQHFGKEFFSSALGCPEGVPHWKFLKFIWHFPYQQRKHAYMLCEKYRNQKKLFLVHNQAQLKALIEQFKSQ